MSNHSTVTYFRTTLDPLDMYRIERIIDHGEDMGTATPAAALAVYLRGIDPSLRWHRTGLDLDTTARGAVMSMSDFVDEEDVSNLLYLDAAVFSHGTNHTIVMGLKPFYFPASRGPLDRTIRINRPSGLFDCISWATSLPVADKVGYLVEFKDRPVPNAKSKDAAWLADFTEPISYLSAKCYSFQHSMGSEGRKPAVDAPAPEVAGFVQVPWDNDTWISRNRPKPGRDLFMDSSQATDEDELTSIVSCVRQGDGIDSLVTIEVQQP